MAKKLPLTPINPFHNSFVTVSCYTKLPTYYYVCTICWFTTYIFIYMYFFITLIIIISSQLYILPDFRGRVYRRSFRFRRHRIAVGRATIVRWIKRFRVGGRRLWSYLFIYGRAKSLAAAISASATVERKRRQRRDTTTGCLSRLVFQRARTTSLRVQTIKWW